MLSLLLLVLIFCVGCRKDPNQQQQQQQPTRRPSSSLSFSESFSFSAQYLGRLLLYIHVIFQEEEEGSI